MTLTCTCDYRGEINRPKTQQTYCPMHGCPHNSAVVCDCAEQMHADGLIPRNAQVFGPAQVRFGGGAVVTVDAITATPVDLVNHPPHYSSHPSGIEAIEITRHLTFDIGNAVKYVMRAPFKGTEQQDLDKARWYVEDAYRHADPVFLRSWNHNVHKKLHLVRDAETNPYRRGFFAAIGRGRVPEMTQSLIHLGAAEPQFD